MTNPYLVEVQLVSGNTALVGRANVTGKSMKIYGFAIFRRREGGGLFVAPPRSKTGERWVPVIEFTDETTKAAIEKAVLDAYQIALSAVQQTNSGHTANDGGF